jgi:hypothetical protein
MTFQPCGHAVTCSRCAERVMHSSRECPLCRQAIAVCEFIQPPNTLQARRARRARVNYAANAGEIGDDGSSDRRAHMAAVDDDGDAARSAASSSEFADDDSDIAMRTLTP